MAEFLFRSKYARYNEELKRRETWEEAVKRVMNMHLKKFNYLPKEDKEEIKKAFGYVVTKNILPSMRSIEDNTLIPTPSGWCKMGELKINDEVFDKEGNICKVLEIEKFKNIDIYEVLFSDNTKIKCCNDHLWEVSTKDDIRTTKTNKKIKTRVVDTKKISSNLIRGNGKNKSRNYRVWNTKPLVLPEKEFKLDPYILGLWLGDGFSSGGQFACDKTDSVEISKQYSDNGFDAHKVSNNPHLWGTYGLTTVLGSMNLLNNKHIPIEYLRGNFEQRLSLLQGLMDTDGCCDKNGRCSFSNTNENILLSVEELLASLGIKFTTRKGRIKKKSHHKDLYVIMFHTLLNVFRLKRKKNRLKRKHTNQNDYRSIVDINYIGRGNSTCIAVDSPSKTYLVSEKMIVTHNSVQYGGEAIEQSNGRIYNCNSRFVDSTRAFSEIFLTLLWGNGAGFGLSDKYLSRLPNLVSEEDKNGIVITYVVEDTIEGWANSLEALLQCYFRNTPYTGRKIVFDYSKIRKKGSPLKTGGGKAPGYKGLKETHKKIKKILDFIIEVKKQERLKTINAYDILMHTADAVLSGGSRRSATSVVFMMEDEDMLNSKIDFDVIKKGRFELNEKTNKYEGYVIINDSVYQGKEKIEVELSEFEFNYLKEQKKISWIHIHPQRARSNNSVLLLRDKATIDDIKYILSLTKQYGEPGFVFADNVDTLFNPCFEISFIPVTEDRQCGVQFCNLSSINGSKITTEEDFYKYCKHQSIIGTLQASYTDFPFLNNASKKLTEEEALLGCSITGFMNNPDILLNPKILEKGADICVETNKEWAKKIGINQASRVTCVKPEGTGSLVLSDGNDIPASGIHPHHAKRYFRRVQCNKLDPIYKFFKKNNPHLCEESVWSANKTDDIITFPIELEGDNIIVKDDLTAIQHLEYAKMVQKHWVMRGTTEANKKPIHHNVSLTVEVADDEWDEVTDYIFKNRKYFTAISLLPKMGDKIYKQAPLERITTEEDEEKLKMYKEKYKPINWNELIEDEDNTVLQSELICAGGSCDIITT